MDYSTPGIRCKYVQGPDPSCSIFCTSKYFCGASIIHLTTFWALVSSLLMFLCAALPHRCMTRTSTPNSVNLFYSALSKLVTVFPDYIPFCVAYMRNQSAQGEGHTEHPTKKRRRQVVDPPVSCYTTLNIDYSAHVCILVNGILGTASMYPN